MEKYTLIAQVSPVSANVLTVYNNEEGKVESVQTIMGEELYGIMLATIEAYSINNVVFKGAECFAKGIGKKLNNVTDYNRLTITYM